jgi:hypothetical protein
MSTTATRNKRSFGTRLAVSLCTAACPGRRLSLIAASVVALGAVVLASPAPAAAVDVTFEPSQARPGSNISIPETICLYQPGLDQVWFSDRLVPPSPEGITDFRPVATAILTPVGGEETEFGIIDAAARFVVPRLPAGRYYLYVACWDADACCVPLQPTFRVLGAPDTSTEQVPRAETGAPWWVLGLAFGLGFAVTAIRLGDRRGAAIAREPRPSPASDTHRPWMIG